LLGTAARRSSRQHPSYYRRAGLPAATCSDDLPSPTRWAVAHDLETLAWITGADGRHTRAARLLGAARTIWRSAGTLPSGPSYLASFHDHCEHQARTALGDKEFTAAFQHGTRFTPDQAIDYALDQTSELTTQSSPHRQPPTSLTVSECQVVALAG
jgi:hypothetical protein